MDELPEPCPLQIVNLDGESHTISLDVELLEKILLSEEVRDRKVMVVTVAGAFRQGKSFILNFFLRYLKVVESGGSQNRAWLTNGHTQWLINGGKKSDDSDSSDADGEWTYANLPSSASDEPLKGFSWKGGSNKVTNGILMWSKPFLLTNPATREKIAVLLMDTQGTFDNETIMADWSAVFAMSTLISSVQVYNLSQRVQENDLQNLHVFINYGEMVMACSDCKPFQSLVFLIRDWYNDYEYSFGADGGHDYLNKVLEVKESQHQELKTVRTYIYQCFENVKCFLMPHPGLKVASNKNFQGKLSDIEEAFLDNLSQLAFSLLHPTKLVAKKQQDNYLTGEMLLERFKVYTNAFQSAELPKPKTIFQANAESNHLETLLIAKYQYIKNMKIVLNETTKYIDEKVFNRHHKLYKNSAISQFLKAKRIGSENYQQEYEDKLSQQIDEEFEVFTRMNNDRDASLWWKSSAACGVAYAGAGFAGVPMLPSALATIGTVTLVTWVDKYFNQGRMYNKVMSSVFGGWWSGRKAIDLKTKKNQ